MIRNEVIIGVAAVEKSSRWYQRLLDCHSQHGGDTFEILTDDDGTVVLCLHKWEAHGHPTLIAPVAAPGNGLILFFRVSDFEKKWTNATALSTEIAAPPHLNNNSGCMEFSLRDPDGYYVTVSAAR
ncbi:VOC family protein [Chitinophaga nivalis]|uniref:Glyoxalase/fosfomycin resistance/dioxygenase domain-containing protein n=1 Tax=Chitinophaga nivalis TaxID=2991709 RepID=A0ABT3IK36_9BACT|nr:VOC family protein [Chitinophaga nivalis]MCW3466005.1 hypothetical protein [Chitinophaga nivalis]MCW3484304.1 hypothetical protein [Chitinophaga nivalis]